jgi:hypothetical protein
MIVRLDPTGKFAGIKNNDGEALAEASEKKEEKVT